MTLIITLITISAVLTIALIIYLLAKEEVEKTLSQEENKYKEFEYCKRMSCIHNCETECQLCEPVIAGGDCYSYEKKERIK